MTSFSGLFAYAGIVLLSQPCLAEDCKTWHDHDEAWISLVNKVSCLQLPEGVLIIDHPVHLGAGRHLTGVGRQTIIRANPQKWQSTGSESLIIVEASRPATISKITLDGSGVASYSIGGLNFKVEDSDLINGRAGAVGIAGGGVIIKNSRLHSIAKDTIVPGRGLFNCEYTASVKTGLPFCTAIYAQGGPEGTGAKNYAPQIIRNEIYDVVGPAIDMNRVNNGSILNTRIEATTGWTSVNLYGSSGWIVANNDIRLSNRAISNQAFHKSFNRFGRAAVVFIGTDDAKLPADNNKIYHNKLSGPSGVQILGVPAKGILPKGNIVETNDVSASVVACFSDQVLPGRIDGCVLGK